MNDCSRSQRFAREQHRQFHSEMDVRYRSDGDRVQLEIGRHPLSILKQVGFVHDHHHCHSVLVLTIIMNTQPVRVAKITAAKTNIWMLVQGLRTQLSSAGHVAATHTARLSSPLEILQQHQFAQFTKTEISTSGTILRIRNGQSVSV